MHAAGVALASEAGKIAISKASDTLDNISEYKFENEWYFAIWNDHAGRDGRASIERTYNNGRWSIEKRTLGFVNGRWYCCLT